MISLAGVIGVGIFVNTATALRNGGPIGLILGFMTMGFVCWSVMISLGEMVSYLPIPGGHIRLAERFGNKALAFAMGWNYWYNWVIVLPAELSAAAILIDYWGKRIDALWISICLIVVVTINMLGAGVYGECEFIFASIKILTIIGLIILGIVLDLGGGPNHDRLGFRYWKDPGPFVQYFDIPGAKGRFLGYWSVLTTAAFSFIGTEIVAIAAGETKNPRRNVPRAIKRVYIRIIFFYMTSVTIISVLLPSNNPSLNLKSKDASGSPFVIAIKEAGIKGLPGFINACLLTITYLRFYAGLKAQGIDRKTLPYASVFQPYVAWFGMIFTFIICFFSGWTVFLKGQWATDVFVTNYFPLFIFPIIYTGARYYFRTPLVDAKDMDFVTDIAEIEAEDVDDEPPKNKVEAVWRRLDFRSTDGLYNLVKSQYPNAVVKGRDLFDASLFRDPTSTAIFYTFIAGLKSSIDAAEPSPTHRFIKTLDTKGKLLRSYTQNIDGLEERAGLLGSSSEAAFVTTHAKGKGKAVGAVTGKGKLKVNEVKSVLLHGDIHRVRCTLCSANFVCEEAYLIAFRNGSPPDSLPEQRVARSARPLAVGTLRPAIVLYDEPHPLGDEIGAIETRDLGRKPDLLIIMGTSLKVHGLKKLVKEFASAVHQPSTSSNSSSSSASLRAPSNKGLLNKVIFVNKTPPGSEWNGVIDYHVEGLTDDWVEKVLEDWKKMRPADWEVQTTLEDTSMRVVKELGNVQAKPAKNNSKKSSRVESENINPFGSSSQSSQKTVVDHFLDDEQAFSGLGVARYRTKTRSEPEVVLPLRARPATGAVPLSPSKRHNRTYTTAAAVKASQYLGPFDRESSSATLLDDQECESDTEAPMYDSESERSSPRKKRRSPTNMLRDEASHPMPKEERRLLFDASQTGSAGVRSDKLAVRGRTKT
ncbi:hypothetical protein FRB99_008408 [Tulasnella sp. 403]|nr:hypothetical protein FRB99_008408 [Tulasnella sp. 403]